MTSEQKDISNKIDELKSKFSSRNKETTTNSHESRTRNNDNSRLKNYAPRKDWENL